MQTTFLNMAGTVLFTRDDMEQGNWTQEEYTVNCTYPYDAGKVITRGMRLAFRDPATNNLEMFEIRNVTNLEPDHYQQIIAEHISVSELSDEHINTTEITDKTPAQALTTVLTGTLWSVGNSTVSAQNSIDISRGSVWQAVNSIGKNWNCYITPRVTVNSAGSITGRYLDIAPAQGTFRGVRLSVDKNMSDSSVVYDDSEVLTALYGYGGSVDKAQATGDDKTEELTFADVVWTATQDHPAKPADQTYLEDPAKTALYGRNGRARFGYYQNGNIKDAEILLEKTWEALKNTSEPKISISGTVTDLYRLGYADQPLRLHDTAIVEVRETGEVFSKEIIRLDVDLIDPTASQVEIGDYIPNIIYINRETDEKAGGGGGGGGGNRGKTELETELEYFDSDWIKASQQIGMIVGIKNGSAYIKAASIVASINDDGGTSIKLSADTIDIDGFLTAISGEGITCADLNCVGSVDADQDITAGGTVSGLHGSFDTLELTGLLDCYNIDCQDVSANDVIVEGALTVGATAATWQNTTVVTGISVSTGGARWYATSTDGQTVTGNNYFNPVTVVSPSTSTLNYLGDTPT